MWHNNLPAETVLAAIVGAVLSTLMAQFSYFVIDDWKDSRLPLEFIGMIVLYGVSLHFYCAAIGKNQAVVQRASFALCLLIVSLIFFRNAVLPLQLSAAGLTFKPNAGAILMVGVLLIWGLALRLLTTLNSHRLAENV